MGSTTSYGPLSARLDLKAPAVPRSDTLPLFESPWDPKQNPGRAGALGHEELSSVLDAPILSQGTNQAMRGSRKRPDPPTCQGRATAFCVPMYPGAGLAESQDGPNGEFCGHIAWIRCGLFKRISQSRLIISRSVRD